MTPTIGYMQPVTEEPTLVPTQYDQATLLAQQLQSQRDSAMMPEFAPINPVTNNPQRLYINFLDPTKRQEINPEMYTSFNEQLKAFADDNFFDVLKENIGMGGISANLIRRMSVMPGGAPMFQEPRTPDGHTGPTHTELIAVVPHLQQTRRMFRHAYGTQGADRIPDCTSVNVTPTRDGDMGFGNPGGSCKGCEFDTFVEGIGRACSERQAVFVMCEGQPFPHYIDLSVYSQQPIQRYLSTLLAQHIPNYWQVVHKIRLTNTQSRSGQSIAIFDAEPIGIIDATDPLVCKGLTNLRTLCQITLRNFTSLVETSKTVRLQQAPEQQRQSIGVTSANNLPLPPSMAGQANNAPAPQQWAPQPPPPPQPVPQPVPQPQMAPPIPVPQVAVPPQAPVPQPQQWTPQAPNPAEVPQQQSPYLQEEWSTDPSIVDQINGQF